MLWIGESNSLVFVQIQINFMIKTIFIPFIITLFFVLSLNAQDSGWQLLSPLPQTNTLKAIQFVDSLTGWAVGEAGTILKTSDAGETWQTQSVASIQNINSMHFLNNQIGWIVGSGLYKTTNGGATWQMLNIPFLANFYSIHFSDEQNGVGVGANGSIFRTTNGGNSWVDKSFNILLPFWDVYFVSPQVGWVCGEEGWLIQTTNGGATWKNRSVNDFVGLLGIQFTSNGKGFCMGTNGFSSKLYKSSVGDSVWQFASNLQGNVLAFHMVTDSSGYAVNSDGLIHNTTNGGSSWSSQQSPSTDALYGVHFINSQKGMAVGSGGRMLRTTTGGILVSNTKSILNSEMFLYPNPATDFVRFSPSTPLDDWELFDARGKNLGTPSVQNEYIDLKDFPKGIYMVRSRRMPTKKSFRLVKE
jgi:photosystem II stability/assembly factor-like uncharacterized protein